MEPSRVDFCHPFQPYDIQLQFMTNLYYCIENGQVGIFESPTGTGKSLSLICGALTWLRNHKRLSLEISPLASDVGNRPDWLVQAELEERRRGLLQQREALELKLATVRREELNRAKFRLGGEPQAKRPRHVGNQHSASDQSDDDQFLLADYESEDETKSAPTGYGNGYSAATQALLDKLKPTIIAQDEDDEPDETKIIFCSRTHSQLSQFANELRRVKPPASYSSGPRDDSEGTDEFVKHLSLGSRKNLCINPKVSKLGSTTAINERCLELQKPGTRKEHKCSFLPNRDTKDSVESFRHHALAHIQDIEDIGNLGRRLKICPYYASRSAIAPSEIIALPYPLLLQKSARQALGISIKNNIIVIDEAHNLMDAISGLFSMELHLKQLEVATVRVTAYVQRFKARLKGKNRVYITQVIRLLNSITDFLSHIGTESGQSEVIVTGAQLMAGKGVDQIRPHKLIQYLQESKLIHKVEGYDRSEKEKEMAPASKQSGTLMHLQNFLIVLMNPAAEGRFFVISQTQDITVRYTLLDPREHFRDIVEEARAVILAGGTMSPISDYADYLFSYLPPERLVDFSFGHVIPPSNLFTQAVVQGPSSAAFEFTFENRKSVTMTLELGQLLRRICLIVPDGVVVFFPSYEYLAQVSAIWKTASSGISLFSALAHCKPIFEETRGIAVDELLRGYTQAIDEGKGGLMLSVVGGKLSEGINFSDKLGRAVVAVGLPFPNINGAEWKAKIEHVEKTSYSLVKAQGQRSEQECRNHAKNAGRNFYENACMRAVNQCIGRAIRHRNDYAAILLVDRRFATDRIENKLPQWIRNNVQEVQATRSWTEIESSIKRFFASKQ